MTSQQSPTATQPLHESDETRHTVIGTSTEPHSLTDVMNAVTERMKFHWDVWSHESKLFWRRVTVTMIVVLLCGFWQLGLLNFSISWIQIPKAENVPKLVHAFLWVLCGYLIGFTGFALIDLFRHRVPDSMESYLHNNFLPPKGGLKDETYRGMGRDDFIRFFMDLSGLERGLKPKGKDLRDLGRGLYYLGAIGAIFLLVIWQFGVALHLVGLL